MSSYRRSTKYLIGRESQRVDVQHFLMDAVSVGEPGDRRCIRPYQQRCSAAEEFARQDSVEVEARRVAVNSRRLAKVFGQIARVFWLAGGQETKFFRVREVVHRNQEGMIGGRAVATAELGEMSHGY